MKRTNPIGQGIRIAITLLSVLFLSSRTNAQAPVANFTANVVSGCSPLVVQFNDQSTGNPTSWLWDLGNGSTSSVQNPTSTYITSGFYTIKLTITNASGSNTITKTNYITVNAGPTAAFSSTDTTGCTPHTVNFTDQSTGAVQWEWNFGDGATSTQQTPSHTYTVSGTFNVFVKVTNSQGCSNIAYKQQHVRVGTGSTASFVANIPNSCSLPIAVNFVNNSNAQGNITYTWNFGDGGTSTQQNPSHIYTSVGIFTITLNVQSGDGCTSSYQQTIRLSEKKGAFTAPDSACVSSPTNFIIASNPTPVSQVWNMGDGSYYSNSNISHTYQYPGNFNVTLISEFPGGCVDTMVKQIKIISGSTIDFIATDTTSCQAPLTTNFQSLSAGLDYSWNFGDGGSSTLPNPSHTFTSTGFYDVSLTVIGNNGCAVTTNKRAYIKISHPSLSVTNVPVTNGCLPYSFSPKLVVHSPDKVIEYRWDFGDGSVDTSITPSHNYASVGTYNLKLVIKTTKGCIDSVVYANAITIGSGDPVDFSASPTPTCMDQHITFTPQTGAGVSEYAWYFGDGDSASTATAIHSYKDIGSFTVTLNVKYGSCESIVTKKDLITIVPPKAEFRSEQDCGNKLLVRFTNISHGAGSVLWDFGDGTTSTAQNPLHLYSSFGDYQVILTINNGTCSDSLAKIIQVRASAIIDFISSSAALCKEEKVTLKAATTNTTNIVSYSWSIPNGPGVTSAIDSAQLAIYEPGVYDLTLIVTDSLGCKDTMTKAGYITIYGPKAKFSVSSSGGCVGTTVAFQDSTITDGTHNIIRWKWYLGDSTTSSQQNVSHTYSTPGRYTVGLEVWDSYGCFSFILRPNSVNITDGKAGFTTSDTLDMGCTGNSLNFIDTSRGVIVSYIWDLGDRTISNVQHPSHRYTDTGVYIVRLKIVENSGCTDSISKSIIVKNPKAAFGLSDTFTTCPPLTVNFWDSSYYVRKWAWDFKDGSSSPIANPVNNFFVPGVYNVTLTVTSAGGCKDSTTKRIRILGPYGNFSYAPLTGCSPLQVNYTINNTEAVKFLWDFSDGITDSGTVATNVHTYTNGGKFVPKVLLTDVSGCRVPVIGTDTIVVEKTTIDFDADRKLFCDTASASFVNLSTEFISGTTYRWLYGDGNNATGFNPSHNYTTNGLYDVTVISTTPSGCTDTLTKLGLIKIVRSPAGNIQSADTLCKPALFTFTAQLQPDTSTITSWSWNFGNGQTSTVQTPPQQSFPADGSYPNTVTILNASGCSTTLSKTVVVNPLPNVAAFSDTLICFGSSAQLQATGAASYNWLNPATLSCTNCPDPVATPAQDTKYFVQGTSSLGCSSTDSVLVSVLQPYKLSVSPIEDSLCLGKSVQLKAFGAPSYTWSPANGLSATNISNPIATPDTLTVYKVVGTDSLGCFADSATITLKTLPNPTVEVGPDITLGAGNTANLNVSSSSNVVTYSWSPSVGLSCTNCQNPTITGGDNVTYVLKATTASGCSATDKLNVIVTCNDANVFVPNTFTPNGDGMNDVFYVRGKGIFAVQALRIFNRWGELVFEKRDLTANDASHGWNGIYKGQKAPTDSYVYQLEVLCTNRQILKYNGTVSLVQ